MVRYRFEQLAQGLLRPMNPYVASILGGLTLSWGVFVLNPWSDSFTRSDVYSKAIGIAPEWAWGALACLSGISILLSIFYTRARPLGCSLGFTVWHWFTLAGLFWWGDPHNAAGLTYSFIAIYAVAAYLNIRVNYVKQGLKRI